MTRLLLIAFVLAACGPRSPDDRKFILIPSGPAMMAVSSTCSDDLDCDTIAGNAACTVSQGCVDRECKFAVAPGPSCPCYEGDIRWCGGGTSRVQFCAETATPGVTAWQSECGPTKVACPTAFPSNPSCASGTVATVFDTTKAQWTPEPGATCAPDSGCPADGTLQRCTPSGQGSACGLQTYSRANGWSGCDASNCPVPCVSSTEVCDGRDNDCNGVADDIPAEDCTAPAVGECARGRVVCSGSTRACVPRLPQDEVCGDRKDNDCDGRVDVNTTRDETITDITINVAGGAVGTSVNYVLGPADCGGERLEASFVKTSGDGDCWVFGWANSACRANPDASTGHSTIREACQHFWQQGGDNGTRDCRYIAHSGNAWWTTGTCQGSFRKRVPACR